MNDKKEKKYVIPEAEVVQFANDDIIVTSDRWWDGSGNNNEPWPF